MILFPGFVCVIRILYNLTGRKLLRFPSGFSCILYKFIYRYLCSKNCSSACYIQINPFLDFISQFGYILSGLAVYVYGNPAIADVRLSLSHAGNCLPNHIHEAVRAHNGFRSCFSGTQQFAIAGLFRDHVALLDAALLTFAISFRYAFYGFSLIGRWRDFPLLAKLYLICCLTDENFALEVSCDIKDERAYRQYCLVLVSLTGFYWLTGCTLGALAGERLPIPDKGIEFVMAALFIVILTDQIRALLKGGSK